MRPFLNQQYDLVIALIEDGEEIANVRVALEPRSLGPWAGMASVNSMMRTRALLRLRWIFGSRSSRAKDQRSAKSSSSLHEHTSSRIDRGPAVVFRRHAGRGPHDEPWRGGCLRSTTGCGLVGGLDVGDKVRSGQGRFETYHLTCMVCGALPGTTCIEDDQELAQVHPSRRMTISERNWRFRQGWEPPELVERRRKQQAAEAARAALFNPRHGPMAKPVRKALRRTGLAGL